MVSTDGGAKLDAPGQGDRRRNARQRARSVGARPARHVGLHRRHGRRRRQRRRPGASDDLDFGGLAGAVGSASSAVGGSVLVHQHRADERSTQAIGTAASITRRRRRLDRRRGELHEDVDGLAFAGRPALVAVGAQVVVVNDSASTQKAHVDGGASDPARRRQALAVTSTAERAPFDARDRRRCRRRRGRRRGRGRRTSSGDTEATVGDVAFGAAGSVGGVTRHRRRPITRRPKAITVRPASAPGSARACRSRRVSGTTPRPSAAPATIAGGVAVTALGNHTVDAETFNVASGAFAAGVTVAKRDERPHDRGRITELREHRLERRRRRQGRRDEHAERDTRRAAASAGSRSRSMVPIAIVSGATTGEARRRGLGLDRRSRVEALGEQQGDRRRAGLQHRRSAGSPASSPVPRSPRRADIEALVTGLDHVHRRAFGSRRRPRVEQEQGRAPTIDSDSLRRLHRRRVSSPTPRSSGAVRAELRRRDHRPTRPSTPRRRAATTRRATIETFTIGGVRRDDRRRRRRDHE